MHSSYSGPKLKVVKKSRNILLENISICVTYRAGLIIKVC